MKQGPWERWCCAASHEAGRESRLGKRGWGGGYTIHLRVDERADKLMSQSSDSNALQARIPH